MTSIIRIKYSTPVNDNEQNAQFEGLEKEILININCPLQLLLNYIRNVVRLDDTIEFDLCDEINCQLRRVSFFEPYTPGFNVFQAGLTYLIVTYQRDANGQMINLTLLTDKAAKRCSDVLQKFHILFKKNLSAKSSLKKNNTNKSIEV